MLEEWATQHTSRPVDELAVIVRPIVTASEVIRHYW